jgi:cell wall-associated NlpC family hydrolase
MNPLPSRGILKLGLCLLLSLALSACSTLGSVPAPLPAPASQPEAPASTEPAVCPPTRTADKIGVPLEQAQAILDTARCMKGTRYKYGGVCPTSGFDCSGFTHWVYSQNGIDLPRSSTEQFEMGKPVGFEILKPGDLIFFRVRRRNQNLHVGIVTGPGTFIHSPNRGDRVREESFLQPYWVGRYIGARRILN